MKTIRSNGIEKLIANGELPEEFLSVVSAVAGRDFGENGHQAGCRLLELIAHGGIVIRMFGDEWFSSLTTIRIPAYEIREELDEAVHSRDLVCLAVSTR